MKKHLLFLLLFAAGNVFSQLDYKLTHGSGTYAELSGATDITDDVWTSEHVMKMPFSFKYFDVTYDTIHIMMNVAVSGMFFSNGGVDLVFFGSESYYPENDVNAMSPVSYVVSGTTPDRILKVQFKNVRAVLNDTSERYVVNNQVWFYETSNKIEYHFGPNEITDPNVTEHFIGIIDADNSPYLAIEGTAANPSLVRVMSASTFKGINSHPLSGQIYTLSPSANVSVNQLPKPYKFRQLESGFQFSNNTDAQIGIYDFSGKLLVSFPYEGGDMVNQPLTNFPPGIYMVNIQVSGQQFLEKIWVR